MVLRRVHVRGCRDGVRDERTRLHYSTSHTADRTTAFAGRARGFSAGTTPLCDLPGLLGRPYPGIGLAGNLGGPDEARAESNAHAAQCGPQRDRTPCRSDRARSRNEVSQRAAACSQSPGPLDWRWKLALLAARPTITDALVV